MFGRHTGANEEGNLTSSPRNKISHGAQKASSVAKAGQGKVSCFCCRDQAIATFSPAAGQELWLEPSTRRERLNYGAGVPLVCEQPKSNGSKSCDQSKGC